MREDWAGSKAASSAPVHGVGAGVGGKRNFIGYFLFISGRERDRIR